MNDLALRQEILGLALAAVTEAEERGVELPPLPTERPKEVLRPVVDAETAAAYAKSIKDLEAECEEIDRLAKVHKKPREAAIREIIRAMGGYERERADGKGRELCLGSLYDWAQKVRTGKTVETPLVDLRFTSAQFGIRVDDLDALEAWCFENGKDFVKITKEARLAEIKTYVKGTGEIPSGCVELPKDRYESFSIRSKGDT